MIEIEFSAKERQNYTIVSINLGEKAISPDVLSQIKPPEVNATKGIVLDGRAPIWLYSSLVHHYHPTSWVATVDPRLGGAVVVASHNPDVRVGTVIAFEQSSEYRQGNGIIEGNVKEINSNTSNTKQKNREAKGKELEL